MSNKSAVDDSRFELPPARFFRHPYVHAMYGAYDGNHVRVEQDGKWGLFTRDAVWLDGPLRTADPQFARWVTGKVIMQDVLQRAGQGDLWA